jgi:hypothetical protein
MWGILSAFVMLDAGREVRRRMSIMMLYAFAALVGLASVLFLLQGAQLYLAGLMAPPLASLLVAAILLMGMFAILLVAWFRKRQNTNGSEIGKAMLATIPLAGRAASAINPRALLAVALLGAAAIIGNRLARKN